MNGMPDGNTAALNQYEEEQRDMERDVEAFKEQALSDLVWRVMENEEGRPFDLVDFLAEQKDLPEQVMLMLVNSSSNHALRDDIESRLRKKLEDSEAVQDRAEEMSREE